MKKKEKNEIFYSLCTDDLQNVAKENFGRKLTSREIKKVLEPIADRMPWHDAIYEAIKDTLEIEELDEYDKEHN